MSPTPFKLLDNFMNYLFFVNHPQSTELSGVGESK